MLTVVRTSVSCPRTAVGSAATGGFVGSAPDCVPCVDNKPSTAEHIVEVALCVFVPCVSVCVCRVCVCVSVFVHARAVVTSCIVSGTSPVRQPAAVPTRASQVTFHRQQRSL